ncbi:hypothetical protein HYDPIDRAFT_23288 [Hydnomerulius pinastri MD-312]|nr:hypothetical protein HYDPIDRAFT_23288 [Hydnomerulius pinastri MD-312]
MDTHHRIPLQDLPLEQFITASLSASATIKSPRKHKRPLSPSRTTPFNPAKRRVLDAEGIPFANSIPTTSPASRPMPSLLYSMQSVTPTRPSRLGNGYNSISASPNPGPTPKSHTRLVRNHGSPQATITPSSSRRCSPPVRVLFATPAPESSTDPQSRHYPGFDVFRGSTSRDGSPVLGESLSADVETPLADDKSDVESSKENVPPKRKAKKISSKKRISSAAGDLSGSCLCTPTQRGEAGHSERAPLSDRQPPR